MPAQSEPVEESALPAAKAFAKAFAQPATSLSDQVRSTDLLKGQKAVAIEHNGLVYRLQTTKLGKLILTK